MRILLYILTFLVPISILAQPYFVDTLNATPYSGSSLYELSNHQGYAVSHFGDDDFNVIYTDLYGHRTGQKSWNLFGNDIKASNIAYGTSKTVNNTYVAAVSVYDTNRTCPTCYFGGIVVLNADLTDTLWTKKYSYVYQGNPVITYFNRAKIAPDGSIWVAGSAHINFATCSLIMHLSATGQVLFQRHYPLSTGSNGSSSLIATPDGGCIFAGTELAGAVTTYDVFFVKLSSTGVQEWYNKSGNPTCLDLSPFPLLSVDPTEYWLLYAEGQGGSAWDPRVRFKAILVDVVGGEIENKYLTGVMENSPIYDVLQLPDKSVVIGSEDGSLHPTVNVGYLYRYSANMDSISSISLPNLATGYTLPYEITQGDNGNLIISGAYINNRLPNEAIMLTRLDSTGRIVSTSHPNNPEEEVQLQLFPNPAYSELNIQYADYKNKQIIITNALGVSQKTVALQGETTTIPIFNLSNGIYYVSIYENGRLLGSTKLVVLHE